MQIGIVGINHKVADVAFREQFAKACERRFHPEQSIHPQFHWVLLSTCNRTEIYFSSPDLALSHSYLLTILRQELGEIDFDKKAYSFFGEECFIHLVKVTSGLDSACLLETEIQGQVKKAYGIAQKVQLLPPEIHLLFQKSLFLSRKMRASFSPPSLEKTTIDELIWKSVVEFSSIPEKLSILFVGASEINKKVVRALAKKGCHLFSLFSSKENNPQSWISDIAMKRASMDKELWGTHDLFVFATKQKEYLLRPEDVEKWRGKKLCIDLSIPRVVDPDLGKRANFTLQNIDEIHRDSASPTGFSAHFTPESKRHHQKIKELLNPILCRRSMDASFKRHSSMA